MGTGPIVFVAVMAGVLAAVGVVVLIDVIRDRPKPKVWHVWNRAGRLCAVGDPWDEHDEDYEKCACRSCFSVELSLMQDNEVLSLFLGRIDTPEGYELADRLRRWVP